MIPSLLSHMSPKEPPTNTLITINPLFFESSMKQCHLSKPREREMEPGGTVFTWERWPGENGEQKGVPCAEVVVRISLTDMLISSFKITTDTFFLTGQI